MGYNVNSALQWHWASVTAYPFVCEATHKMWCQGKVSVSLVPFHDAVGSPEYLTYNGMMINEW
jgi:hypothetical protein